MSDVTLRSNSTSGSCDVAVRANRRAACRRRCASLPDCGYGVVPGMTEKPISLIERAAQHLVQLAAPAAADRSGGCSRAAWQSSMPPSGGGTMRSLYLRCTMRHFSPIQRANLPPVILSAAAMVIDDGVEATVATAPATKLAVSPAPMRSPSSFVLMPMAEL